MKFGVFINVGRFSLGSWFLKLILTMRMDWYHITFGDNQFENWTNNFHSNENNWVIENWLFCLIFLIESVSSMREPKSISQSTRVNCPSVNIYLSSNIFQYFSHLQPIERFLCHWMHKLEGCKCFWNVKNKRPRQKTQEKDEW
jgi:hypothetical protein